MEFIIAVIYNSFGTVLIYNHLRDTFSITHIPCTVGSYFKHRARYIFLNTWMESINFPYRKLEVVGKPFVCPILPRIVCSLCHRSVRTDHGILIAVVDRLRSADRYRKLTGFNVCGVFNFDGKCTGRLIVCGYFRSQIFGSELDSR